MASTMTCGELKNTTFTKNEGGFEDDLSFKKVKEKSATKQFKSNDKSKVFQVRPGARIIKLNSKEQYNAFKQELADRMNIPVDQINSIEDILKDKNSIYDGIMIGPKLQGSGEGPLLKDGGLKIYNENAIAEWGRNTVDGNVEISKDAAFESMRSRFKAGGTEITDDMRRLSESLYNDLNKYKNAVDNHTADKYDVSSPEGEERYKNFHKSGREIELHIKTISDERFDKTAMITDFNASKATSDGVYVSAPEIFRVHDTCNSLGNNIGVNTVASALTIYEHYNHTIPNYNQNVAITNLENSLKDMSILAKFDEEVLKAAPPTDYEFRAPYKLINNKTSEDMHREKLIWDKVIQSVKPEHREQLNEIAKVCMANSMQAHLSIKGSQVGSINFGDKKVNFIDGKTKVTVKETSRFGGIKSKISSFRNRIVNGFNDKKTSITNDIIKTTAEAKDEVRYQSLYSIGRAIKSLQKLESKLSDLQKK